MTDPDTNDAGTESTAAGLAERRGEETDPGIVGDGRDRGYAECPECREEREAIDA